MAKAEEVHLAFVSRDFDTHCDSVCVYVCMFSIKLTHSSQIVPAFIGGPFFAQKLRLIVIHSLESFLLLVKIILYFCYVMSFDKNHDY